MQGINEYLYKYGLHDCIINNISCEKNQVTFAFNSGVYNLDLSGKEISLTSACKLIIEIDSQDLNNVCNYVITRKIMKNKCLEVALNDLINMINDFYFEVEINYYSHFNDTLLIKGSIKNEFYEITISNVNKIQFMIN